MFEQIRKLIQFRGESLSNGDSSATSRSDASEEAGASRDQETSSGLFRCSSCEAVYIAQSKETCETCGTAVTQISATPSHQSTGAPGQYLVEEW